MIVDDQNPRYFRNIAIVRHGRAIVVNMVFDKWLWKLGVHRRLSHEWKLNILWIDFDCSRYE